MPTIDRRQMLTSLLGATAAGIALNSMSGCSRPKIPTQGVLLEQNFHLGHRVRQQPPNWETPASWTHIPVIIVGGGIAGLSAGWRLRQSGVKDFAIFELENQFGGTSRSSTHGNFQFPWAAHYITTPMPENVELIELLSEMGIVEGKQADGSPIIAEQYLCREPEERLFQDGQWIEGLYPKLGANQQDLEEMEQFQLSMRQWSQKRDDKGRKYFSIPIATSSDDPEVIELDRINMLEWMKQQGWTSERLHWYVDYACRDDYGLNIDRTSAWAGILYFAARLRDVSTTAQDVITWPAGNGFIVDYLTKLMQSQSFANRMVAAIQPPEQTLSDAEAGKTKLIVLEEDGKRVVGYTADRVIFAAPQFVARHVIAGWQAGRSADFRYSAWLVANIHLKNRPKENGYPLCWDNVIHDSKSLGYVVSTHQTGLDHGPTVVTWYYPLEHTNPAYSREQLMQLQWSHWADVALADLERAHSDIRELVERIDIMRWGHAMVQPYPGFLWDKSRRSAATIDRTIHFANTDLSGVALLEEAFYHGVRAADEVIHGLKTT